MFHESEAFYLEYGSNMEVIRSSEMLTIIYQTVR